MARGRARKVVVTTLVVLASVIVGAIGWVKLTRTSASKLTNVHSSVWRVRNSFTDFYGAKIGIHAILFDAGVDTDGKALDTLLGKLGVGRDDVSNVFLGHGHFDHVAASPLCAKARIHVGVQDTDMLAHRTPVQPRGARWFNAVLPVPPIEATDVFFDRAEIGFGDKKVVAIPFPGHTPGSYLFVFDGVLFASDSLQLSDGKLGFAMPLFSVDMAENKRSALKLKAALQGLDVQVICTGHQGCTEPGEAQKMLEGLYARAKPE